MKILIGVGRAILFLIAGVAFLVLFGLGAMATGGKE
jgi:hypothetical protein